MTTNDVPSVFAFQDPREFMAAVFARRRAEEPGFSLRAWARSLGYANPSLLSQVMRGERSLRSDLAQRVANDAGLGDAERNYFNLLVVSRQARGDEAREAMAEVVKSRAASSPQSRLSLDKFRFIADWYHLAILEMTDLKDFQEDPDAISARLGSRISPALAQMAIERLVRMGLLKRDKDRRLKKTRADVFVGEGVSHDAIRSHHRQAIELAKEALNRTPVAEREIVGTNLSVRRRDLPRLKELVRRFHEDLHGFHAEGDGEEVYRVNIQVFPLTERNER